jgi:hypothetical protein
MKKAKWVAHKMYAVCYEDTDCDPKWVPYTGSIYHFRCDAKARSLHTPNGRIMPVMVSVLMPAKKASSKNREAK